MHAPTWRATDGRNHVCGHPRVGKRDLGTEWVAVWPGTVVCPSISRSTALNRHFRQVNQPHPVTLLDVALEMRPGAAGVDRPYKGGGER